VCEGESDAEGDAGVGEAGVGAEGAVLQAGAVVSAASGGMVAGDAAGGGDSGGGDCREDGIHGEDGVPDGAGGTEAVHFARTVGEDGAGGGVRPGVRAGSVGAVAGGSGDGIGGAGGVEEEVYGEKDRDSGTRDVGTGKAGSGSESRRVSGTYLTGIARHPEPVVEALAGSFIWEERGA